MKNLIVALIVGVIALFCVKCNASELGVDEACLRAPTLRGQWLANQRKGAAVRWVPGDFFRGRGLAAQQKK